MGAVPTIARPALRIYARTGDAEIRFVGDGTPVLDAERLVDAVACGTLQEVRALEAACRAYLDGKMPAGADGWHRLPASAVPTLLRAARGALWAGAEPGAPPTAPEDLEPAPGPLPGHGAQAPKSGWSEWSDHELDILRALAMKGMTAKQIAPHVGRRHDAVQRKLNRLSIHLREMPRGTICFRLPLSAVIVFDKAAAVAKLTRNELMRRQALKAAEEPARYGLTVVSA